MVTLPPKFIAVEFTNRNEIIEAVKEIGKMMPDSKKIMLLIDLFNKAHNSNIFTYHKYAGCGDCQRNLRNFWNYVIAEWNKK